VRRPARRGRGADPVDDHAPRAVDQPAGEVEVGEEHNLGARLEFEERVGRGVLELVLEHHLGALAPAGILGLELVLGRLELDVLALVLVVDRLAEGLRAGSVESVRGQVSGVQRGLRLT
jgi:8-oxo-dGTP pyrophosphatase MutT (NUDIX family)